MDPKHHPLVRVIQDMYRMKVGSPQLPAPTRDNFTLPMPIGETVVNKTGPWITSQTSIQPIWPINSIFINQHLTITSGPEENSEWKYYKFHLDFDKELLLSKHAEHEQAAFELYDVHQQLYTPAPVGRYLFFGLVDRRVRGAWGYLHPITD